MEAKIEVKRMYVCDGDTSLKAFCDIAVCDSFLVKGVKVVEGKNGLFVSMPREQGKDEKWHDTFYPLTKDVREKLQNAILEKFYEK
jgi:stage V sporulation protein G